MILIVIWENIKWTTVGYYTNNNNNKISCSPLKVDDLHREINCVKFNDSTINVRDLALLLHLLQTL